MMSKFKVGDRVRCIADHFAQVYDYTSEAVGTIAAKEDDRWEIKWDHTPYSQSNWSDDQIDHLAPTGPVREVTRKEIVPGVYGRLSVSRQTADTPRVLIALANEDGRVDMVHHGWSLEELRSAADVLTQLADALEPKP